MVVDAQGNATEDFSMWLDVPPLTGTGGAAPPSDGGTTREAADEAALLPALAALLLAAPLAAQGADTGGGGGAGVPGRARSSALCWAARTASCGPRPWPSPCWTCAPSRAG